MYNGQWQGRNSKWYRLGWGGNQHTGGRSLAVGRANSFRFLGRASFFASAGISGYQLYQNTRQGNYGGAGKSVLDAGMAYVGTFGGPKGLAVSSAYFAIDTFIGWEAGPARTYPHSRNMTSCHTSSPQQLPRVRAR